MKKIKALWIVLVICGYASVGQAQENNWLLDFDKAQAVAKQEDKPILISFAGSDWCKPCIKLTREVFEQPEFSAYAKENLVLLLLDFPRLKKNALPKEQLTHNEQMAEKYNKSGAFPLVVLIDANGQIIDKTGYQTGGAAPFVSYLEEKLN